MASIKDLKTQKVYTFNISPITVSVTNSANITDIAVLRTKQPIPNYKGSKSTVTFKDIRFYGVGVDAFIKGLEGLTKPDELLATLPIVEVTHEALTPFTAYISELSYEVTKWENSAIKEATGSMSFVLWVEAPKPQIESLPVLVEEAKDITLSERERETYALLAKKTLDSNVAKAKKYAWVVGKSTLTVDEKAGVTINGKAVAKLSDIIPENELTPAAAKVAKDKPVEKPEESKPKPREGGM